jgi:hypothetical protein
MKSFIYQRSLKFSSWGCSFDSLLELKYALSIQYDYEFLRSPVSIYYDPGTRLPVTHVRKNIRRYTPDFLIRHKISQEAYWVEIKPRVFELNQQLVLRREVAENYIRWKGVDWKFKIVFDDEIILTAEDRKKINQCRNTMLLTDHQLPCLVHGPASGKLIQFVMFGDRQSNFNSIIHR